MRPIIEFCSSNMHHGTEKLMKALEANPDYDVVEYGCLGNCGTCYMFPYALVNGEIVEAANAEELEIKIYEKIKEIEAMYEVLGGE
ncbi:UDP-N-acetylmuramoylalanine--D-glutamate ligase [Gordoniibacillus kamchatkensis]|uniref:UDP-N-acetylmuramoylalanine--D-glutamate ligase n=1 Tax=Gordoniibacillus kamchatkensis TaxID=1590651 RepID=A0ABR5ALL4_9BACL|nr:YuzB family protein [Paenibacillus sp. VKM B-2647]KIL41247.1 UDP-N-acetylmuramoylalanine--D-glutamate ligase [Paenibacillus sp. VKM B-2647]